MASRVLQQAERRFALGRPSPFAAPRVFVPTTNLVQTRYAATASSVSQQVPRDESLEILVRQRLNRPVAPHLAIYKPQITWILSSLNRVTGVILSGGIYVFGIAYLAAPMLGLQITSAAMAASFAKWPLIAKVGAKAFVAAPFMFHSWNGIRHLIWDTGRQFTNMQVIRSGWFVVGLTAVTSLAVLFY